MDFAQQTGSSADASSGLGYVTVTPLPAGTLFTETQSNLDVTWTTYNVTVTINGTDFPVSFSAGDTKAVVIEKVPVGASLSASATIGVPENLGYPGNSLTAATAAPTTIQSGANTITMWVQYPLEFHVSTAHQTNASITGTQPAYYTNASATPLPETTATYTNVSTNKIMRFTGWAFENNGTPVITSTSIPPSIYKGKLSLYASYGECALHITGSGISAGTTPVIAADGSLALTAVAEGFPAGAAISYSWRVVPPASGTAPATVSGSGASATVYPVAGAGGSATVEVTAASGALTASAMLNVDVQVGLPDFTVQITPPASYNSAKSDVSNPATPSFALTDAAASFSFTPVPAPGKSFPAGTTFSWTVDASSPLAPGSAYSGDLSGTTAVGQAASAAITASGMAASAVGYTPANAASITVTCTAHHTHAPADKTTSAHASAFMLYTLPDFTVRTTIPAASAYNAAGSDLGTPAAPAAVPVFALTSLDYPLNFTATATLPAGTASFPWGTATFPTGTVVRWEIKAKELTANRFVTPETPAPAADVFTEAASPSGLGLSASSSADAARKIGTTKTGASPISIKCTISNPYAVEDVTVNATAKVYRLTVPAFKIVVTPPAGITSKTSGTGASAVTTYLFGTSDVTDTAKKFKLEAVPVNDTDSFPDGTNFAWKFHTAANFTTLPGTDDGKIRNETAYVICNSSNPSASGAAYTIECKPVLSGAALPDNAETEIRMKLLLGSKSAPTAVGDIVFSDGSAEPYVDGMTLTDEQKDAAIAVIFDAANKLGVGLKQGNNLAWCTTSANAYSRRIIPIHCPFDGNEGAYTFTGDTDGSDNLAQIASFLAGNGSTDDTADATKYPAFYFAKYYKDTAANLADTDYETGWYLPSLAELFQIYASGIGTNRLFDINAAIGALGGDTFGVDGCWSSSQYHTDGIAHPDQAAWWFRILQGSVGGGSKTNAHNVRVVRKFN